MMRKILCFCLLFCFLAGVVFARQPQDKRRIEEEKRDSLAPTEAILHREPSRSPVSEASSDLQYLTALSLRKTATLKDAFRLLDILLGCQKQENDFARQFSCLSGKKIISADINPGSSPQAALRRGQAAYMFYQALGIRGGLVLKVFGVSQRYALAELAFEGIMERGSTREILSGAELVDIFTNAAEYMVEKIRREHR